MATDDERTSISIEWGNTCKYELPVTDRYDFSEAVAGMHMMSFFRQFILIARCGFSMLQNNGPKKQNPRRAIKINSQKKCHISFSLLDLV